MSTRSTKCRQGQQNVDKVNKMSTRSTKCRQGQQNVDIFTTFYGADQPESLPQASIALSDWFCLDRLISYVDILMVGNFEVNMLMVGDVEVGILKVGHVKVNIFMVDILIVGNREVIILMVGHVERLTF
jgi:hypothetical protein